LTGDHPFLLIISLLGGVSLLLYGLHLIDSSFQEVTRGRLRGILSLVSRNRLLGACVGVLFTFLIQSSGATTAILVGLVGTGVAQFSQVLPIILGADLGTTLTVQLIATPIYGFSPLIIAAGFSLFFFGKRRRVRTSGLVIFGFGLIFLALRTMSDSMSLLQGSPLFQKTLLSLHKQPFVGFLIALVVSAVLNSSAATLGMVLALASKEIVPLQIALPMVLGANLGTSATAWVASIGRSAEARRVAASHTFFKAAGVLMIYPFLGLFEQWVLSSADALPRQIANAHTLFNAGLVVLFLPITPWVARWMNRWIPNPPSPIDPSQPRYLDPQFLDSPPFALNQATREALRMAEVVQGMFRDSLHVLLEEDQELLETIERRENIVDHLNREIKFYITRMSEQALSQEESAREMALLSFINDLENIGDIIDINLLDLARKKSYQGLRFSEEGTREIIELHQMVARDFETAVTAFSTGDQELAQKVTAGKAKVNQRERELRAAHIRRLHRGLTKAIETSAIHLDILTYLRRIRSHVTALVYPVLESRG
jgi:phosphate:Na+ symporter